MKNIRLNSNVTSAAVAAALGLPAPAALAAAGNCNTAYSPQATVCSCGAQGGSNQLSWIQRNRNGTHSGTSNIGACSSASDSTCSTNPSLLPTFTTGTYYFKNTGGTGYFHCDFTLNTGFSNPVLYTPAPADTTPPTVTVEQAAGQADPTIDLLYNIHT